MKCSINKPMPDQTIGITKMVRAAKAQKEIKKTMRMANAMAMADAMKQGPLHHNMKK